MITNTKAQDWRTPRPLFDQLNREYRFTVDAAASISNHLLPRYWTRAHNALNQSLAGETAFCNPPFGMISEFLEWGLSEADNGYSVFLVPGSIETEWYLRFAVHGDKHVFRRRVAYVPPPNVEASQPSFSSILVIFGPDIAATDLGFSCARNSTTGERIPSHNEFVGLSQAERWAKENPERTRVIGRISARRVEARYRSLVRRAAMREIPFELSFEDYATLRRIDTCPICTITFLDDDDANGNWRVRTIDRVHNEYGYAKKNVACICRRCNAIKNAGSAEEHRRIADWISAFQ